VALQTGPSSSWPPEPPGSGSGATARPLAEQLVRRVLSDIRAGGLGRHVRLELACQPGLEVRQDTLRFQNTVATLVRHAAAQAPSGRVLVTCAHQAGRLRVAVADDGVGAESAAQEAALRATAEELALQGGALEITSRAGEGSTIVAYWPDVRDARAQANRPEVATVPSSPDVPQVQSLIDQSG
jgi:signal transduction histidine kinase